MTRFARIFLFCLAGILCLRGVLPAAAQDIFRRPAMEAFVDKDTLLVFPAQVDSFQKVRVRKNENPVFGTVVRYENELGTCADVYIYSLDTGAKPVGRDTFEKHCQETDRGILDLHAQNQRITAEHIDAPGRKTPDGGFEAHYRILNGSTPMDSVLFLALYKGKIIKIRISYSPEDKDESAQAGLFIDVVAAMLNKEKAPAQKQDASHRPQLQPQPQKTSEAAKTGTSKPEEKS